MAQHRQWPSIVNGTEFGRRGVSRRLPHPPPPKAALERGFAAPKVSGVLDADAGPAAALLVSMLLEGTWR
jgi:hypothetical protein